MSEPAIIYPAEAPKGPAKAVRNSLSALTAGVGGILPQQEAMERPELIDHTSQEAFEKFKKYNTDTNLRTSERRMWGGLISQIAGNVMFAAAAGLGVSALAEASFAVAAAVFVSAVAVTAVSFFFFQQTSTREQSERYMDVDDYKIKRSAGEIAKEIKKALQEDGPAPVQKSELIVIQQPANENTAPSTQLAVASHSRQLQAMIEADPALESTRA